MLTRLSLGRSFLFLSLGLLVFGLGRTFSMLTRVALNLLLNLLFELFETLELLFSLLLGFIQLIAITVVPIVQ